ncbi:J domain-containing protein [Ruegeria lacuscaerulensis]|uniref:J domain-containing protein n=1 Tax=Ruegeria lacuscaerulensis TaxID=55218 RepID=UPI00147D3B25|nr:J domain-containing protein [Ruegeria lacuscaerulensis]
MEAVEKIKARTDALFALGLDHNASSNDIRNAWRKIAFSAHPDRADNDCSDFVRAKDAYDLLRQEGLTTKNPMHGKPKRPKLRKRVIRLKDTEVSACRDLLARALAHSGNIAPTDDGDQIVADSDHIPSAIECFGRNLIYFVKSPVCKGANRVALPTSVLVGFRKTETEVLNFQSKNAGAGEVVVPDAIMARKFPGAKSVRIRFDADQALQDAFELAS